MDTITLKVVVIDAETQAITVKATGAAGAGRRSFAGQNVWDTIEEMQGDLEGQLDTWFPDNAPVP